MTSELISVLASLPVGFIAGVLAVRGVARWCRLCGATLQCLDCHEQQLRRYQLARNVRRAA